MLTNKEMGFNSTLKGLREKCVTKTDLVFNLLDREADEEFLTPAIGTMCS
jgi:hypothetical protein